MQSFILNSLSLLRKLRGEVLENLQKGEKISERRGLPAFTGSYGGLAPGSTDMKPTKHAN
jgi:hypothetical protein